MKDSIIPHERVAAASLDREERIRYSRHLMMPELALEGQLRLKAARVLCIGAGGLGSPAALYLAAAGVGTIGLVDADVVDLSNLQRQILHGSKDIGRSKLDSARARIHDLNPRVELELHNVRFAGANATELVQQYDIVLDGSDNFPTRYLSNDVCVFGRKPNVYGSIFRFEGQTTVFAPHLRGPCYRCLFPVPPSPGSVPNCAEAGVLGVLPGIIGTMQALETIKLITGVGDPLIGRLLHFDAATIAFQEFNLRHDPQCPVCGENPTILAPIDYEQFCGGAINEKETNHAAIRPLTPRQLKQKLDSPEPVALVDVREQFEHEMARIEGSQLIPLGDIASRIDEVPRDRDVVLYCKVGLRSALAIDTLQEAGFTNLYNLEGGIDAWSDEIDPALAKY